MTRESRVGTVVAGSFLCLLAVVVASKWRGEPLPQPEEQGPAPQASGATGKEAPKGSELPPTPLAQAVFNSLEPPVPPQQPAPLTPSPSEPFPVASTPPALPLPPGPPLDDDHAKKMQQLQQAAKDLIPPLPAAPGAEQFKDLLNLPLPSAAPGGPARGEMKLPSVETKLPGVGEVKLQATAPAAEQLFATVDQGKEKKEEKKDPAPTAVPAPEPTQPPPPAPALPAAPPPAASGGPLTVPPPLTGETQLPVVKNESPPLPGPPAPAPAAIEAPPAGLLDKTPPPAPSAPAPVAPKDPLPPVLSAPPVATTPPPAPAVPARDTPLGANLSELPRPIPTLPPSQQQPPPAGGQLPEVKSYATQVRSETCQPGETSFGALSRRLYGSERYAGALQAFNREHLQADPGVKQDPPRLQPGTRVFAPPPALLESTYADLLRSSTASGAAPPISIRTPTPLSADPNPNLAGARVPPPPTADVTKRYVVPARTMMLQLARETLGDGGRWGEIYRLNPNLLPQFPIEAGTELRLPTGARVP